MKQLYCLKTVCVLMLALIIGVSSAWAEPWKFGVMCYTQWPNSPDNKNPNVAVNVINHLNQEFINQGVKFVVQVGDLTDNGSNQSLDIRATFSQAACRAARSGSSRYLAICWRVCSLPSWTTVMPPVSFW